MLSRVLLVLATATFSTAHFILHWPETAGFDDDNEGNGPCGGATVTVNSSSPQIQVERFAVMIQNTHPAGEWVRIDKDMPILAPLLMLPVDVPCHYRY